MTPREQAPPPSDEPAPLRLDIVHPVYLDVPMMVSFLAALRDGVSFEDESTKRTLTGAERDKEGGATVRIPALVSLLGFDMSGRMSKKTTQEETEEVKAVRQHTSASLFNALRRHLQDQDLIQVMEGPDGLASFRTGQLVEVTGAFVGNPLEDLLALIAQMVPYMEITEGAQGQQSANRRKNPKRSGNPQVRARADEIDQEEKAQELRKAAEAQAQESGLQLFLRMGQDLTKASVHDVVLEGGGQLKVVLTMSSEFFSDATGEYLRAGYFTALGKITRILRQGEEINLTRRTVLGVAKPEQAKELIQGMANIEELAVETSDPIITYPAIQLMPLAVFV